MRLLEGMPCEGGATAGYKRAGWHVTAVDTNANRLRYNPADVKIHGDAIAYVIEHGHKFDAIHLSPPCQWYTRGRAAHRGQPSRWERSIPTAREAAQAAGVPYVIENVKDAGWDMLNPMTLCGCQFGLQVRDDTCTAATHEDRLTHAAAGACDRINGITVRLQRPRLFESNVLLSPPAPCDHATHEWVAGAYGGARRDKFEAKYIRKGGYVPPDKPMVAELLGVDHPMTWEGLFECLPPAYTEHIGHQLRDHLEQDPLDVLERLEDERDRG